MAIDQEFNTDIKAAVKTNAYRKVKGIVSVILTKLKKK